MVDTGASPAGRSVFALTSASFWYHRFVAVTYLRV
jgi:hypothetical protein